METNPLIVKGVLYAVTAANGVIALDAATGQKLWRADPKGQKSSRILRGVTYWNDGAGDARIFFTAGAWLHALDAKTGQAVAAFGHEGKVDLKAGLGPEARDKAVYSSTPGTLAGDLLIMPTTTAESADAALGSIQAFDVRSGRLAWVFHTIPRPGEPGHETWSADAYRNVKVGGANCWAGMAVDPNRGIVYVPTGSAAPDFWGGDRIGANLYANSLLALEAATGRLLWHYQMVHHDLWDRDLPAPPSLVTLRQNGRVIEAVAQVTKSGHVFVFDRVTGVSLFPIHERPAPPSELPGEVAFPTQPIPELPAPFARQRFSAEEINPHSRNREALVEKVRQSRTGSFQPFGKFDTLLFPGFNGGAEWGGAAVDPEGIMYVNANNLVWIGKLKDTPSTEELARLTPGLRLYLTYCAGCHGAERGGNPLSGFPSLLEIGQRRSGEYIDSLITKGAGRMPGLTILSTADRQSLVAYLLGLEAGKISATVPESTSRSGGYAPYILDGYVKLLDIDGYPANRPPWGTLTAIDLNSGQHRWSVPLGEFKELTGRGIAPTGTENYGGPVVTASGLLFIAATMDHQIRAFDTRTGDILWEAPLPAGGHATPSTYEIKGRQYVVIACGGGRTAAAPGDSLVAFALP